MAKKGKKGLKKKTRGWNNRKSILMVTLFLLVVIMIIGYFIRTLLFIPNVKEDTTLFLRKDITPSQLIIELKKENLLIDNQTFESALNWKSLDNKLKAGAYRLKKGMSNNNIINLLRSHGQTEVKVTFNNVRTREQLAGKISKQLMEDSVSFLDMLEDSDFIEELGFTKETFPAMFLPNSYNFYWTTTPTTFALRMKKEYDKFWNAGRLEKAKQLRLTPVEVSTLASIVQEESNNKAEQPVIAGVYINRLRKGWPLQADPTVKFAIGDFTLRRVLNEHLTIDSPYNTYKYPGLPPGPINFPELTAIDAVLNAAVHNYFYFCAKPGYAGTHNFAATLAEHNRNAQLYRNFLNKEKIFK